MRCWAIDGVLFLVIAVGAVLAWETGRERVRLQSQFHRLVRKTGDLTVGDRSLVYVQAVRTGEPLHFAWRIYLPPKYRQILKTSAGNSSWGSTNPATEFLARLRFRESPRGGLEVYSRFSGSSSMTTIGDRSLTDLLRGRWDEVVVEQLGSSGLTAFEPGRQVVVLRLTLPQSLLDEAKKTLSPDEQKRLNPVVYEMKLGPEPTKP